MRIALCQCPPTDGDEEAALARIAAALATAAAGGATLLVMPELVLPGYNRPDLHGDRAQPAGGAWEARLGELAREAGCGLALGWAEREGGRVFNTAGCFDPEGRLLARYRKRQLFGPMEARSFVPGATLGTFRLEGLRAGLLVCYDVEFAETVRALAEAGAELILVPTANPRGYDAVARTLLPARALETGTTIVYANYCGAEAGLAFGGLSTVVGPDGEALATAGRGEALLIVDLAGLRGLPPESLSTQSRDRLPLPPVDRE